jgi:hypothetical protein
MGTCFAFSSYWPNWSTEYMHWFIICVGVCQRKDPNGGEKRIVQWICDKQLRTRLILEGYGIR